MRHSGSRAYILKYHNGQLAHGENRRHIQAQRKLLYNLNKERQKLVAQGFDRIASALSERLGVTEEQIVEMQQRLDAGDVSLDLPVSDENGSATRLDFLPALGPGIEDSYGDSEVTRLVQNGITGYSSPNSPKRKPIFSNTDRRPTIPSLCGK